MRRLSALVAATAVALSGLVWTAAPASAIETISANPSSYTDPSVVLDVTVNGFPTMVTNNYYVYWLDFTNVTGANSGDTCPAFTLVGGSGTPTPTGSGTPNPTLPPCEWVTPTKFRFVYQGTTGLNATSQVKITFPANSFTLPAAGEYGVTFTAGASQQYALDSVCLGNCPVGYVAPPEPKLITIDIDGNSGACKTAKVTGFQGAWATAPDSSDCTRTGFVFTGFNTQADGSGLAIAPGGNLNLTGDNTLYAQWAQPRVPASPATVVATGGMKGVKVSWAPPTDAGSSPIAAYLVQATPGGSTCVTNQASANILECTYANLVPGTTYTFKVQALNRAGWSEFSGPSNEASPYNLLLDSLARPEVKFLFVKRGSTLEASGRAPGLDAGTVLTPVMQVGADGAFVPLTRDTAKVDGDGAFSWSRKLDKKDNGKPVSLYFTYDDARTATLTAKLGAFVGLPTAPLNVRVESDTSGITVSWRPPARDGGSPITEYVMTSDLPAAPGARSKFVACTVQAPRTSCTMRGGTSRFDPTKTYTFSVAATTERGTGPQATTKWKGELYRLNIFKRARVDSEVLLSFSAVGWANSTQAFEIQAKVGENGTWRKQGVARLNPEYVDPIGDWQGMLPKSATAGSTVFYRVKSNKGFSNEVRFPLSSSFAYSFG